MPTENSQRCEWAVSEPCRTYHDEEWGNPIRDDQQLFEMITLEGAQAGLSWETVLKKREGYRKAFHYFQLEAVASMKPEDVETLMANPNIIRNRAKILATINNAQRILELHAAGDSFSNLVWSFVGGETIVHSPQNMHAVPSTTEESLAMSKSLLKRGFKFVGPTICYAFMQAAGLVDDHTEMCFRHISNRSL